MGHAAILRPLASRLGLLFVRSGFELRPEA
jgi:hypothetical protein